MTARRITVLAMTLAAAAIARGQASPQSAPSSRDLILEAPATPMQFRFLPSGDWISWDRPLRLGAQPGEERSYRLETRAATGGTPQVKEYLIDKRPPPAPRFLPLEGSFNTPMTIRVDAQDTARVSYVILVAGSTPTVMSYDPARGIPLVPPASGTLTYSLAAWSEDTAGNRSLPRSTRFRLASPGMDVAAPPPGKSDPAYLVDTLADFPRPEIGSEGGLADLRFAILAGMGLPTGRLVAAVSTVEWTPTPEAFFPVSTAEDGTSGMQLACPYGWAGQFRVTVGIQTAEALVVRRDPFLFNLSDLPLRRPEPVLPGQPSILAGAPGTGGLLVFPSFGGVISLSIDEGPSQEYAGPIPVAARGAPVRVRWHGTGADGVPGPERSLVLDAPPPLPVARLSGVADGVLLNKEARFYLETPAAVRYELREDGSVPPEPNLSSSLLEAELVVDCSPGEEKSFVLRYRGFTGFGAAAEGGESTILRFSIDRKPPAVPDPESKPPALARSPQGISFIHSPDRLFVSLSLEGEDAPFEEFSGPLPLPGSRTSVRRYLVRAYAVDAAGNRSREMEPISTTIDLATIVADSRASAGGDGSAARPFPTLEMALVAARTEGRRLILLSGDFRLTSTLVIEDELVIDGSPAPGGSRARILLAEASPGRPSLLVRRAALTLRGIDVVARGVDTAIHVEDGELAIHDAALALRTGGDLGMIRASGSRVAVSGSSVDLAEGNACSFVDAEDSEVLVSSSSIVARAALRNFAGFSVLGGSLNLADTLIEGAAPISTVLLRASGTRIEADRCLLRAEGGTGFLRLGLFKDALGEIRNCRAQALWSGDATLFEFEGTGLSFVHDTLVGESGRGGLLRFFESSGSPPTVWNCILETPSGRAELIRATGTPPGAGNFVSNCIWGFERLVSGGMEIVALADLDRLNGSSPLFAASRNVSESPSTTFSAPLKNLPRLRRGSACIDAGMVIQGPYDRDFSGQTRPSASGTGLPDIGADEYRD